MFAGRFAATVAGHSAGAIVAVELAIRRPELVRALVLLDPALYVRRYVTFGFARTRLHEEKMVDVVRKVLKKMSDQEDPARRPIRWHQRGQAIRGLQPLPPPLRLAGQGARDRRRMPAVPMARRAL
jgi:pimeloyl-ACP methyl ester carboxylesterase